MCPLEQNVANLEWKQKCILNKFVQLCSLPTMFSLVFKVHQLLYIMENITKFEHINRLLCIKC